MKLPPDFKEFLELLNARNIEYMIVGSYALAYYGAPRYTGDIDLFVKRSEENAEKLILALADFGFKFCNLTEQDFLADENIIQLGMPPVRIDILTFLSGLDWEDAFIHKEKAMIDDIPVFIIGKDDYIINKRKTGRAKDIADVEAIIK